GTGEQGLVSDINGSTVGWFVELVGSGGPGSQLRFWMINTNGSNLNRVRFNFFPATGTAFHACVSTDGTFSTAGMLAWVNGVPVSQSNVEANTLSASIASGVPAYVGLNYPGGQVLNGGSADVRIY